MLIIFLSHGAYEIPGIAEDFPRRVGSRRSMRCTIIAMTRKRKAHEKWDGCANYMLAQLLVPSPERLPCTLTLLFYKLPCCTMHGGCKLYSQPGTN